MLAAVLAVALSQWGPEPSPGMQQYDPGSVCQRTGGRCFLNRSGNRPRENYAFFEFAPASGAGMGTACACTTPTGAKGEALTFTRTGNATCSKQGLATTGILNGDLVVCAGGQPRVESSGGVLGLRVEGARTNETLRSQEINNVVWATTAAGVAAPTITADFAAAPDGTTTADRMQIPACPTAGVDASGVNQTSATIASPSSSSVYLKANAGTPSVSVCMYGITTGTRACTQFALNTSTWTRAVVPNVTNTGGMNMEIACENRTASYTGATNTGAADILVWGAQSEAGAYATSYIPTVAAGVTRNADDAYFDLSTFTLGNLSLAATAQTPSTTPVRRLHGALTKAPDDGANFIATHQDTVVLFGQFTSTAGSSTWNTGLATTTGPVRAASFVNGANVGACINSTCATNPIGTFNPAQITSPRRLRIGAYSTTNGNIDGVATLVCFQPDDPTRCR